MPSGTKWATTNIGAAAPEEYGDYFAWGETVAKKNFTWSNYKYATTDSTGNLESLLKYNSSDSLRTLLLEDDAAAANWGEGWRTPSQAEWNELVEYCTATEEYVNGVRGKLFTSKFTGKSIFIPFAGYYRENKLDKNKDYSYLWSSNVDNEGEDVGDDAAARMYLNAAVETWGDVCRAFGFSVRPVYVNDTISVVIPADTTVIAPVDTASVNPEYVDLGLPSGIKWATTNIGAATPEEYGSYFAWGETEAKTNFTWSNYKYATTDSTGNLETLLKYNSSDSLRTLLPEDDAATANWGKAWRTPTQADWNELVASCTATEEYVNGVRGKLFTSKFTGKSIFIPFAGYYRENKLDKNKDYSYLWSSNVDNAGEDVGDDAAARMYLNAAVETWGDVCRAFGFSVRPVYVNDTISVVIPADTTVIVPVDTTVIAPVDTASVNPEYVDLGLPSGIKWATTNIGAATPEEYGDYFAWGETVAKKNFTWSNYKYATTDSTGNLESLLKYNSSDSLRTLLLEDDAAAANWGKGWRTPSQADWNELVANCTATEKYVNGVRGKLFVSKINNNSIFIPFAGYYRENKLDKNKDYSYLWSSNVDNAGEDVGDDAAARMYLNAAVETWGDVCRAFGFSVRPVYVNDTISVVIPADTTVIVPVDTTVIAPVDTASVNPEYVDLGLPSGIKWATTNIGAATPEEYGSYFAWGETEAKTNFTWSNYKYATTDSTGNLETLLKYNSSDSLRTLLPEDDAATANWGKAWRTPTQADWNELVASCTATEEYVNGVRGKLFVSKINNNSIFIPFAGYYRENKLDKNKDYSYLWSSNVDNAGEDVGDDAAARMYLNAAVETWGDVCRAFGFSVRPVRDVKR